MTELVEQHELLCSLDRLIAHVELQDRLVNEMHSALLCTLGLIFFQDLFLGATEGLNWSSYKPRHQRPLPSYLSVSPLPLFHLMRVLLWA